MAVRNSILACGNPVAHRWMQPGCFNSSGICSQGIRWNLCLASSLLQSCILLRGATEAGLTFSWRILSSASLSEKCSTLVSCRSISVSHTRMLSLVPSNSSLWLVKCCRKGEKSRLCWWQNESSDRQHGHFWLKGKGAWNTQRGTCRWGPR